MSKVLVIIPVCLQVPAIFDKFRRNLSTLRDDCIGRVVVLCNRLSLMTAATLESFLSLDLDVPVEVIFDKERSVAGAWNRGIEIGLRHSFDHFLITAVDVAFGAEPVKALFEYGLHHPNIDVWSSTPDSEAHGASQDIDWCDFSCFMLRDTTISRHGWFDKEYKPAYFEDNDYLTRVVLGGGSPKQVLSARHTHQGSLTIKLDAEMAHHVHHWFGTNRGRFLRKWGQLTERYADIPQQCFSTPMNSGRLLSWWPEQDRDGYSPSGGIHD